jgi:hypothetical protein
MRSGESEGARCLFAGMIESEFVFIRPIRVWKIGGRSSLALPLGLWAFHLVRGLCVL